MSDNNPERLSATSKAYDRGQKGYLSDIEKAVRGYDTDNDGKISTEEVFRIVEDVYRERSQKQSYKKFFQWSVVAMVILLVGNFGLVWATVALTKEVKSEDGKLEDADTGNILQTRSSTLRIAPTAGESGGARRNLAPSYLELGYNFLGRITASKVGHMRSAASIGERFLLYSSVAPSNRNLAESGTPNLTENGSVTRILNVDAFDVRHLQLDGNDRMLEEHGDGSTTITTFYMSRNTNRPSAVEDNFEGRKLAERSPPPISQLMTVCPPNGESCELYSGYDSMNDN